jgi:hypothetical protein
MVVAGAIALMKITRNIPYITNVPKFDNLLIQKSSCRDIDNRTSYYKIVSNRPIIVNQNRDFAWIPKEHPISHLIK